MDDFSKIKLAVIVVSYNSADELKESINAAQASIKAADVDGRVIVVDNNSKDRSLAVASNCGATVISNKLNLGFAKAVNQGTRRAFENGADYILVLNPDAVLEKKSLRLMLQAIDSDDKIGAAGPMMVNRSGEPAIKDYYLKTPSWISVLLFSTVLDRYFRRKKFFLNRYFQEAVSDNDRIVEQIPGACLLTSKAVLDKVGLLDEDFAIWFEDVEWCWRARKKGYLMYYCAEARVVHEGGISFGKWQNLDKSVTFFVSMKTFFNKAKPFSGLLVRLFIITNALLLAAKHLDRSNLVFIKRFIGQKKGTLPQ